MRKIPSTPDKLYAMVEGDIEDVDGLMRITKIRVRYHLKIPKGTRAAAERALATHPDRCPAAASVKGCIQIDISSEIEEE